MPTSEFGMIASIKEQWGLAPSQLVRGIGEDCAVFEKDENHFTVISTDCLVENIHFDLRYFSFYELGQKSLSVNLSDIAAMAATPLWIFVSLAMPKSVTQEQINDFYRGMQDVAKICGATLAGGDLSKSSTDLFINITVVGEVEKEKCKMRNTAQPGDIICVSGALGSAAVGLNLLEQNRGGPEHFVQALKTPKAQMTLAKILAENPAVHALIDVSDGVLQDLEHVLHESKVAARVWVDEIPVISDFESVCLELELDPIEKKLNGGEDYQLLFTVEKEHVADVMQEAQNIGVLVSRIGEIVVPKENLFSCELLTSDHQKLNFQKRGFDHFS